MQPREEKINPKFFAIPFGQFQARAPTPQIGKPATPQAQEAALRKGHTSAVPCQHPGELSALTNLIRAGLINSSVVEVGDVVVGVAPVALGGVVGDAQVVKARQEHQDADDQHGDGPVGLPFTDVPCQQQGSDDDEEGPDHEEHHSQCNGLVGDFGWALLELQVNVSIIGAGELGIFDFATGNPSREVGP